MCRTPVRLSRLRTWPGSCAGRGYQLLRAPAEVAIPSSASCRPVMAAYAEHARLSCASPAATRNHMELQNFKTPKKGDATWPTRRSPGKGPFSTQHAGRKRAADITDGKEAAAPSLVRRGTDDGESVRLAAGLDVLNGRLTRSIAVAIGGIIRAGSCQLPRSGFSYHL